MSNILSEYLRKMGNLPPEEQEALLQLANVKSFLKDTILLREGQYSKDEYFILKGCVRAYFMIDGVEKTTDIYTEFEPISPICVANNEPSTYYISCVEDAEILVSNPDMNQQVFQQFPHLERICLQMTEQVLAKKQLALNNFKIKSPEQRYKDILDTNPALLQRVPQYQLASYLGITPQSLSRLRHRIKNK